MAFGAPRCCQKHKHIKIKVGQTCPLCKNEKAQRRRQKPAGGRIYDKRLWRDQIRPEKLRLNPLCEICEQSGRVTPATEVDHVTAIEAGGDPYDMDNLQSLCKSCHSKKTYQQDGGFGNDKTLLR